MRLLRRNEKGDLVFTADLHEPPPYAILSHTWGTAYDEVSYQDIIGSTGQEKDAYSKVQFIAEQARKEGLDYFWVDTCCIDKHNDAEVCTAIRSMFRWYKESTVCYVYLSDVSINKRLEDGSQAWENTFRNCRWFSRGWTLQELLAPDRVEFYARGQYVGSRDSLGAIIHTITGIDIEALRGRPLETYPFPTRLRWAYGRATTVPEDRAYALMGLSGVVLTPRYGEGESEARRRLMRKILKRYGDSSLDQPVLSEQSGPMANETQVTLLERRQHKMKTLDFESMESRKSTIKKALGRTCNWILTHPACQTWRQERSIERHLGFFWIKGKPGAGKSVLIRYLDNYISQRKGHRDVVISFYFNGRGDRLERSLVGMYRSLLAQLLRADTSLQEVLDSARNITSEGDATIQELQRLLLIAMLKLQDLQLFCFIDALDECQEQDVQQMIDFFQSLGQEAVNQKTTINICFASRHYPALDITTGLQLVLEDIDEHRQDLSKYVQSQKFQVGTRGQTESIPARMQEEILAKANGVFLWVVLVVDILKKEYHNGRIHAVNKRLRELPRGLSELFRDILQRDRENIDEFILCLEWILYAKRPLALKEFYHAMMAGVGEQNLEWIANVSDDSIHSFLLSSSKGLAELTKDERPRAQFIHESVRDFLVAEDGFKHIQHDHHTSMCEVHEKLKQYCLRGVQIDLTTWKQEMSLADEGLNCAAATQKPSNSRVIREKLTERFPFLDYATTFVLYHSDQAARDVPQRNFLKTFDLNNWVDKANFLQKHDINLYKIPVDLIYICAERDHANLIKVISEYGHSVAHNGTQRNDSPLFAAFANKSKDAARVLLEQEDATHPDEIIHDVIIDNYKGRPAFDRQKTRTSWHWAIEQGFASLALHLLRGNCNVQGGKYGSPLQAASQKGREEVVTMLLYNGANVNTQGGHFGNALQAASARGYLSLAKILLDHGADVNAQGGHFGNALWAAFTGGYTDIAKLLLDQGADVNVLGGYFRNPLQAAVASSQAEILRLLLSRETHNRELVTRLGDLFHDVSSNGHSKIVKVLLDYVASVNTQGGHFGNALQAASAYGHVILAKMLLDYGADVDAQGGHFGTALQAASNGGYTDIVKLLLDQGADVNVQGGFFGNALQAASAESCLQPKKPPNGSGNHLLQDYQMQLMLLEQQNKKTFQVKRDMANNEVVTLLLDKGANVNVQGGYFGNALQAASAGGHVNIAKLLLDHGADMNVQGGHFGNAPQAASARGHMDLVTLLDEHARVLSATNSGASQESLAHERTM
ncbi:hypothetical protein LTR37_017008 [Vermiconidia calcicola]|uniref:Uncharacterized protein n=1 Tax=Vermiconidia calcicola TaxID=1690605 RepID=A0ACC3MLB2_9PEZI|nr:hypothetical protein LTR37_017008 [Vermiconidia calcicola]